MDGPGGGGGVRGIVFCTGRVGEGLPGTLEMSSDAVLKFLMVSWSRTGFYFSLSISSRVEDR